MVEVAKLFGWPSKRAFFIKANLFSVLFFGMLYFGSYRWELGRDKREGEVDKSDGFFYWIWFSLVTQTTVGYSIWEDPSYGKVNTHDVNTFKIINIAQLISIFVIAGYSL
jgi:hypothetical protein